MGFKRQGASRLAGPVQVAGAATTILSIPDGIAAVVRFMHVQNPSGATVYLTMSVGADAAGSRFLDAYGIPAHSVKTVPIIVPLVALDRIQAFASAAATLTITLMGDKTAVPIAGLGLFRAIGNCELLFDAIEGMTGAAGVATSVTDLSGNGRVVTFPATVAPGFTSTTWNGTQPALQFTNSLDQQVKGAGLGLAQPYTVVTAIQDFGPVGGLEYLWSNNNGTMQSISFAGFAEWQLGDQNGTSGTAWVDGPSPASSQGRRVRIDIANGANPNSMIARGSTEITGSVPSGSTLPDFNLGGNDSGKRPTVGVAFAIVYSKALSASERALVISLLDARYSGLTLT